MKILAIETSCDETSVAVVEDGFLVHSLVVNSQIDLHKAFGGVVPEVAARSHIEVMLPVVQQALDQARCSWNDIDAIAVTQGPGLLGSLLIGVLTARTLAWSLHKPLIAVHHILGHVYANWITKGPEYTFPYPTQPPSFPVLALIVSGGHTQLMYATNHFDWKVIGRTQDDAVGEAFDKVAKVLGFPYPGGLNVERAAMHGDPTRYALPTPKVDSFDPGILELRTQRSKQDTTHYKSNNPKQVSYNFSFSGLKTAVLRAIQQECGKDYTFASFELKTLLSDSQKADFAASFQKVAIKYLVTKTSHAYKELQPKTVIIGGGIAASESLRAALSTALPLEISYAPRILCTDNAAMIGARAYFQYQNNELVDPFQLETKPSWPL